MFRENGVQAKYVRGKRCSVKMVFAEKDVGENDVWGKRC